MNMDFLACVSSVHTELYVTLPGSYDRAVFLVLRETKVAFPLSQ